MAVYNFEKVYFHTAVICDFFIHSLMEAYKAIQAQLCHNYLGYLAYPVMVMF